VVDAISTFIEVLSPTELNGGEDRLVAQMRTNYDPPKTLEELQTKPTENILGYERHHIVEQTDANIQKDLAHLAWKNSDVRKSKIRAISFGYRGLSTN
jgi:hypothetical protein